MGSSTTRSHTAEPRLLALGKKFGRDVYKAYKATAKEGQVDPEVRTVWGRSGVTGRIDILVRLDGNERGEVVIEVKNTNWDMMAEHRVRPNVRRHARQVWSYLAPKLDDLEAGISDVVFLQGAVIYPHRPTTDRADLIEEMLGEEGLSVAYDDEM
jgi:hypothetical protein